MIKIHLEVDQSGRLVDLWTDKWTDLWTNIATTRFMVLLWEKKKCIASGNFRMNSWKKLAG